jgi:hypothetical protein
MPAWRHACKADTAAKARQWEPVRANVEASAKSHVQAINEANDVLKNHPAGGGSGHTHTEHVDVSYNTDS